LLANATTISLANSTSSANILPTSFRVGNSTVYLTINSSAIAFTNSSGTTVLTGATSFTAGDTYA